MTSQNHGEDYRVPVYVHRTWWAPLLGGLFALGLAWYEFRELEELENGARQWVVIGGYESLLYDVGGKWAVVGIFIPAALLLLGLGVMRLLKDRKGLM